MKKIAFPHVGDYHVVFKSLFEAIGIRVISTPPITKRTLELGAAHSPESVCVPFKYNLGNFIESLEKGANCLLQASAGRRFGYYKEIQELILKDMGYEFEFLTMFKSPAELITGVRTLNPEISRNEAFKLILFGIWKMQTLDNVNTIIRKRIQHELEPGGFKKIKAGFLKELGQITSAAKLYTYRQKVIKQIKSVPLASHKLSLKIGVVGELYVAMEPFSNFNLETKLASLGAEVDRHCTMTDMFKHSFYNNRLQKNFLKKSMPYAKNILGGHGLENVAKTLELIKKGYDGVIHVKPFGCMPEINAMPALYNISLDKQFPVLFMSFDQQTSETGIDTRLEAFVDMIKMRAENESSNRHRRWFNFNESSSY